MGFILVFEMMVDIWQVSFCLIHFQPHEIQDLKSNDPGSKPVLGQCNGLLYRRAIYRNTYLFRFQGRLVF